MNRPMAGLCLAALACLGTATAQTVVNLTPTADTYTQQGTPTTNYGTATTILVRRDPAGTLTRGAYFQFNLSGLPAGTITNARLQLFGSQDQGGTGIDTKIHGGTNTATWSETALTYNNSLELTSTDFSGTPLATVHINPPPAANYSWDVTSFIASRRSVGHATLGLGYVTTDTYRSTFNSKEAASNRPVLIVTIGDTTPPSSPGAVSFSNVTTTSVTASWGAATDNVGVAGYDYRVNSGSWVSLGNVLSTSISGLSPSTNYTISVRARDAAGNVSATPSSNSVTTAGPPSNQLTGSCPGTYVMSAGNGTKTNFPQNGVNRAFVLNLPANTSTPRPVWVPLTGSVESTNENLDTRGGNRAMTSEGFIVIGPVRRCAGQDPNGAGTSVNGSPCNQGGTGGWTWNPWNEGRVFGTAGDPYKTDEGDDSRFLEAIVRCVAKTYPVDATRIFVGGISSGGTMTNRALTFNSDFWAGGEPISGEWYVTQDNGNAYPGANEFNARGAAVQANPTKIFQGRVAPYPLYGTLGSTNTLSPMIVITLWGGSTDTWSCDGGVTLCSNYRPTTQVASNYYSSFSNVVHVACSSHHGHQWPTFQRDAWNRWVLRTLASHPKGTPKSSFVLPALGGLSTDYSCRLGVYTDHY